MKKTEELRKMSAEDLTQELLEMRKQHFNLRFKKASGALEKTHVLKLVKRSIAKIKTIMTEKAGSHDK